MILVKWDTHFVGEYHSFMEAVESIQNHHFVDNNPDEFNDFEFYKILGPAQGVIRYRDGLVGYRDDDNDRVMYGWKVLDVTDQARQICKDLVISS